MKARQQNTFRIIGGVHRGRRFEFPGDAEVRPSPDRVRETLFNWLQPVIAGGRCLDLYAGSGALGLEALSRGAAHAEFVDRNAAATRAIREHVGRLCVGAKARVNTSDVPAFLRSPPPKRFDIVFVDPPYAAGLLAPTLAALAAGEWLSAGARIYIECAARDGAPALPSGWTLRKEGKAGEVGYFLALSE